jgi:hypothetical protein
MVQMLINISMLVRYPPAMGGITIANIKTSSQPTTFEE